ncbi:uncharacterized protein LOC128197902 [Vigna angularis]|uniref:uncharacterized protein LOC128197902 n=1 Tax=Phaseolus angularis TaxID=3914 RepID=UPI0022B4348E|nr:uncharacterized protein LOC128197902 [Vigna angularis]
MARRLDASNSTLNQAGEDKHEGEQEKTNTKPSRRRLWCGEGFGGKFDEGGEGAKGRTYQNSKLELVRFDGKLMTSGLLLRVRVGMSDDMFRVVVHHGGTLIKEVPFNYIGGEITNWDVDPDKWCYFGVLGSLNHMGYMQVEELYYSVQHVLHKVDDDKGAMNMMNVAKYLGEVNLYVVHGVEEATILQNDENEILLLCEGHAESGEDSGEEGMEDVVEGAVEVENEDARDVENVSEGLEVQKEDLLDVDNEDWLDVEHDDALEVEKEDSVYNEDVQHEDAEDDEVAVEVENEDEVESVSEAEIEVESEEEVEVNSDDAAGMDDLRGDEYVDDEDSEKETQQCRGLSDDEWESDKLLTPENSASEEDDNDDTIDVGPFSKYAKQKSMADYKWEVGTIFTDREEFKDAIRRYVVHAGRDLKFMKNDNRRVRVTCMGGQGKCPWLAYCGYLPSRKIWQLRKIIDTHSCSRQLNIKLMNAKWLSQEIDTSLVENPSLKVSDIRTKALRKWNTNVTISKARRAKLIATRMVEGDFIEQYKRVYDYGHELLRCNPGSTVQIKVDSHNGDPIFQRMYVCLKACKDSFISCRPIICLDGCFLKGVYKGELLTAVGRDPNDQMLPLAYAVVEVENKDSWTWFLQLLIEDLGGSEVCGGCTWMSDQQKV